MLFEKRNRKLSILIHFQLSLGRFNFECEILLVTFQINRNATWRGALIIHLMDLVDIFPPSNYEVSHTLWGVRLIITHSVEGSSSIKLKVCLPPEPLSLGDLHAYECSDNYVKFFTLGFTIEMIHTFITWVLCNCLESEDWGTIVFLYICLCFRLEFWTECMDWTDSHLEVYQYECFADKIPIFMLYRMAKTIVDAILSLSFDDSHSNLAAATLFYILTSDVSRLLFVKLQLYWIINYK